MCKHIKFDPTRWAPCAVCMKDKRIAGAIKNEKAIRALIAELVQEAEAIEVTGRKARYERTEIETMEKKLKDAELM